MEENILAKKNTKASEPKKEAKATKKVKKSKK